MTFSRIALVVCLLMAAAPSGGALANDEGGKNGRYKIITTERLTGPDEIILLDTVTGKTWIYAAVQQENGESRGSGWVPALYYDRSAIKGTKTAPDPAP